jgi:hypothetical protein
LMVVVQNFFTSLFNSHIFDFHEGWMYVLGVGVAGGLLKQQPRPCWLSGYLAGRSEPTESTASI